MTIVGFLLFLVVAAICAGVAEAIFPGRIPGGFLTTAVVGIIGGWVGASLFGNLGPTLFGVTLLPTILGTGILVFVLSLVSSAFSR
jgi:uncharacterized membrane protein YeaQ/YmgE (transglycosylase-associated protein family)